MNTGQWKRGETAIPYDEQYISEMFTFWYSSGKIPPAKLIELENCPKDRHGRIPVR
jgi:hypothetical protein